MVSNNELKEIENINKNYDFFMGLSIALFLVIVIIILYARLFLGIDFENWDIQKCNPKYIFYSGYIKKNPKSTALQSTKDNFDECIIRFNNKEDSEFSKVLERNKSEQYQKTEEIANNYKNLSRRKILDLQNKVNSKNKEFQLQIKTIQNASETSDLQNEINKLNTIIDDIKDYAHSYLTYAMMHFVFKFKISEKDGTIDNLLNSDISCGEYIDKTECTSNLHCKYDDSKSECNNITKREFYKEQVINLNNTIKKYFGNNKL